MSNKPETMTAAEFRALLSNPNIPNHTLTPPSNRKVKNATKESQHGVVFDSRIELHMYNLLKMHEIEFVFQKKYTVQESFKYNDETIRAITYTVDFYLPDHDIAIDTKGIITQQGQLRIKMLKRLFADLERTTTIELPRTKYECETLVTSIIKDCNNTK